MNEDFRFVPKRARVQEEDHEEEHPSGLSKLLREALDAYQPIGGRVKGTDNLLLRWSEDDSTSVYKSKTEALEAKDAEHDTAQHVIDENIQRFLRLQMNRYVLKNRNSCLFYPSDAAHDLLCVELRGTRSTKKKIHQ